MSTKLMQLGNNVAYNRVKSTVTKGKVVNADTYREMRQLVQERDTEKMARQAVQRRLMKVEHENTVLKALLRQKEKDVA